MTQMQGIVSILRSDDSENTTKTASLRRTLSADMSSKRWLPDNGLPVIKNLAIDSSSSSSSSDSDQEKHENPSRIDVWTAIMSQKKQDDSVNLPPPYVHPFVKKSRSLSEKSLKVCTESLGSETGSDVFSPNSSCNKTDDEQETKEEHKPVRLPCLNTKRSQPARSFPPPVSSLATASTNGPSVHMQARRVDGRLVLEAVSVEPKKYFEAQRQDGRFLLKLINDPKEQPSEHDELEDEIKIGSDDKNVGILNHSNVTVKRSNTKKGKMEDVVDPARRRPTGVLLVRPETTLVNSYQYLWRAKPTVARVIDPVMTQHRPPTKSKDLILLRGNKTDCLIPSLKGCKEPRRSHMMWEPFYIATS